MANKCFILPIFCFLLLSCIGKNSPNEATVAPMIVRDSAHWVGYESKYLSFEYKSDTYVEPVRNEGIGSGEWFRIIYPQFNASIYCTYMTITPESFTGALDDSYRLAYSHASKADGIDQLILDDSLRNVFGILYDIEGEVATPLQFFVTDSTRHFFRASFYYDKVVSEDSAKLIKEFVRRDIDHLIQTVEWKR